MNYSSRALKELHDAINKQCIFAFFLFLFLSNPFSIKTHIRDRYFMGWIGNESALTSDTNKCGNTGFEIAMSNNKRTQSISLEALLKLISNDVRESLILMFKLEPKTHNFGYFPLEMDKYVKNSSNSLNCIYLII